MAGKRASMLEGPLAALFRKTETEGLEDAPVREAPQPAAEAEPRKVPSPQERLRHAFSSDLPENLMTIEELQYKYGKDLGDSEQRKWANHAKYTCSDWIEEVHNHRTLASYWDWVMEQIQQQT